MASTYSDLKFELIGTGDQSGTWGNTTNDNIGTAIEQAIVGLGNPIFTTDANLTITLTNTVALQTARALVLNATSTGSLTATRELVVPTIKKQYIVQNNTSGGQSITVKTTAGTGITVPNGKKMHLYVDGVNVVDAVSHFSSLTLASALPVLSGGTGVTTSTGTGAVVLSTSPTLVTPALGTPASGTVTNLTGTASININGTVGATTASTGAFTTLTTSGAVTHNAGTANGVAFLDASKVLTTGSALTFDGTNLGVGNTSPSSYNAAADNLVIGLTGNNGITIASGSTSSGFIMFADGTTGQEKFEGQITYDHTNNFMALNTSAIERVRISSDGTFRVKGAGSAGTTDAFQVAGTAPASAMVLDSAGNVGIGTTSPNKLNIARALTVNSTTGFSGLELTVGNASTFDIITDGGNAFISTRTSIPLVFQTNNTERARISADGTFRVKGAGSAGTTDAFQVAGGAPANAVAVNAVGGLKTVNTISVGAATPSTSGAGITFPATQSASSDANTLDDYEEGTWTPTATPATSGTITIISPNLCAYTKIGRVVTVNGVIEAASVSLPVGVSVTIGGLPFTSNANQSQRSAGVIRCFSLTTGAVNTTLEIVSSTTDMTVHVDASLFQAGSQVYFQLTYTV